MSHPKYSDEDLMTTPLLSKRPAETPIATLISDFCDLGYYRMPRDSNSWCDRSAACCCCPCICFCGDATSVGSLTYVRAKSNQAFLVNLETELHQAFSERVINRPIQASMRESAFVLVQKRDTPESRSEFSGVFHSKIVPHFGEVLIDDSRYALLKSVGTDLHLIFDEMLYPFCDFTSASDVKWACEQVIAYCKIHHARESFYQGLCKTLNNIVSMIEDSKDFKTLQLSLIEVQEFRKILFNSKSDETRCGVVLAGKINFPIETLMKNIFLYRGVFEFIEPSERQVVQLETFPKSVCGALPRNFFENKTYLRTAFLRFLLAMLESAYRFSETISKPDRGKGGVAVHLDIKPENICVAFSDTSKTLSVTFIDPESIRSTGASVKVLDEGDVRVTPAYTAPELYLEKAGLNKKGLPFYKNGSVPVHPSQEVFSLGCTIYALMRVFLIQFRDVFIQDDLREIVTSPKLLFHIKVKKDGVDVLKLDPQCDFDSRPFSKILKNFFSFHRKGELNFASLSEALLGMVAFNSEERPDLSQVVNKLRLVLDLPEVARRAVLEEKVDDDYLEVTH